MSASHPALPLPPAVPPGQDATRCLVHLDCVLDGVQVWSADGRLLYANPATYALFELPTDAQVDNCAQLFGHCLDDTGRPVSSAALSICDLARGAQQMEHNQRVLRIPLADGGERWLRVRAYLQPPGPGGEPAGVVSTCFDVSRFVHQEQVLQEQAQYDALTHLPNRVLFADRLQLALATAQRRGEVLAVCMLDLDGFKPINDTLGHQAGDRLLQEIAFRLGNALRADDTAARLGGDEFGLLIGGLHGSVECEQVLNRLLQDLARPVQIKGQSVAVTASVGVSLYPGDIRDPDLLLRHADQAMYQAKEAGKGCFHIFDPAAAGKLRASRQLLKKIQDALDAGQFLLHYQPKVDCRRGRVVGVEALVRWRHPVLGLRTPGEFLPLIEQDDAIINLGEWVVGEALAQMGRWRQAGLDLPVSVNIAARQFLRGNFSARLGEMLAGHPPEVVGRLGIEIVETAVLEDINAVSRLIHHYHKEGVRFDLDDFGTGYSSLTHLKRLAADTLKIDQSFVRDMLDDPGDLTIVQGVIHLARAFHLEVIAEGVEDIEHILTLLDLGCDVMQGYAIARPMPAERLVEWLEGFQPDPRWRAADNFPNRHDFELLLARVIHRFWQQQVLAAYHRLDGAAWPELDPGHCRLAAWFEESGRRHCSDIPPFHRFHEAHREVHRRAQILHQLAREGVGNADQPLAEFNAACVELQHILSQCDAATRPA
ncbi:MAG: EAL domain-containing protein [Pseudomonadota bacterium]